mgnify:CR=1 FL=1
MKKYNIRKNMIQNIQNKIDASNISSSVINVYGDSGTGKTFLIQEALEKYFFNNIDSTIIYINLLEDILSSTAFWDMLLFTTWNGDINDKESILRIDKKWSLSRFLQKCTYRRKVINSLFQSVSSIVASIPIYNAQIEIGGIDSNNSAINFGNKTEIEKSQLVINYFKYISKKHKLIIVIDNYQFMNSTIKHYFETAINQIPRNIVFINIQRTDNTPLIRPLAYPDNHLNIELTNLSKKDIFKYVIEPLYENIQIKNIVLDDCFQKTHGNLKEIDIYIKAHDSEIKKGILKKEQTHPLNKALDGLPQIQRDLVLLAALFPAGLRLEYVIALIKRCFYLDDNILNRELGKIISLGYVMLNSTRKDLLKLSHDKIGLSIETVNSTDEFIEFYCNIENGLEELVQEKQNSKDYIYLLHCYIGICDGKRIIKSIKYLEDLIKLEYDACSFLYLVELTKMYIDSNRNILLHLSEKSLLKLLDSCQKTCSFKTSVAILDIVRNSSIWNEKFGIYYVKVMTQLYKFDIALKEIELLPENNETIMYKLIIYEHLGKNEEILKLLHSLMNDKRKVYDKWYYIILRNTAHFFSFEQAYQNLQKSLDYFTKCGTIFEQATVLNNISVIQIWKGADTYNDAESTIKKAIKKFSAIGSNEIFEAYYNYGTLNYLNGNYTKAVEYYRRALDEVPETLTMDVTLLHVNEKISECAINSKNIFSLEKFILHSLNQTEILQDPWVRFQLEYNLKNIEIYNKGKSDIYPSDQFISNSNKNITAITVFDYLKLNSDKIPICLSLSPNWRY